MISQFYILSPRGDTIINRDFRGDVVKGTAEIFYRKVKFWPGDAPPVFPLDGITFMYLKRNGLYFVATTQQNVSPSYCLELLQQMTKLFKDFCGVLNEEAIRRNFVLIYEILDEILDGGYPQQTTTERLKQCIHNEAIIVEAPISKTATRGIPGLGSTVSTPLPGSDPKTVPSNASHRPVGAVQQQPSSTLDGAMLALTIGTLAPHVTSSRNKNEIFVDILERLTVVTNSTGNVLNSQVDGCIQMKSYLAGNPSLRLALNEDIVIKNDDTGTASRSTIATRYNVDPSPPQLDDCNFHECVDLKDFDTSRVMTIRPPEGEFVVMNYRITDEFRIPFRIRPIIEQTSPTKLELSVDIRVDIPSHHYGGNVLLSCPMPRNAISVSTEALPKAVPQTIDYIQQESRIVWSIKKFQGGSEMTLRCRVTLSQPLPSHLQQQQVLTLLRKEIGPITLTFEIPMYNVSNLQVRYLRISDGAGSSGSSGGAPFRWVRYVTQSSSYVCRL